jgi:hypothetical protein
MIAESSYVFGAFEAVSISERMLHGIGGISAPCHAMPLLLTNMPFYVNYLVE